MDNLKDAAVLEHLAGCPECFRHARLMAIFNQGEMLPPPSPIKLAQPLPHPRWLFRRPATYLPLALGLAFMGAGARIVLPGGRWPARAELTTLWQAFSDACGYALWEAGFKIAAGLASILPWQVFFVSFLTALAAAALTLWARWIRA